jgi:hypothetical protein
MYLLLSFILYRRHPQKQIFLKLYKYIYTLICTRSLVAVSVLSDLQWEGPLCYQGHILIEIFHNEGANNYIWLVGLGV